MTASEQLSVNKNIVSDLLSNDNGIRKSAAAQFDKWLVTYQRQDGVFRKYMPPTPVESSDFAEEIDNRDPVIYRTIKPHSAGAITTNFDTGTVSTGMYADKYKIYLHRAWTPKYRIDTVYLSAYKGDLLGVFKDLSLQDLLGVEDLEGITMVNACVGTKSVVNPEIGIKQYIDGGSINPDNIAHAVEGLTLSSDNLSPAKALVHRSFWYRLITTLKASNYGDRVAENTLLGNMTDLEESLFGIKWLTILDRKLVPALTVYISADAQYCGDFVTYEDAKITTELKDSYWFEMQASEMYGMSMPYRGCVTRTDFSADAGKEAESWFEDESASSSSSSSSATI